MRNGNDSGAGFRGIGDGGRRKGVDGGILSCGYGARRGIGNAGIRLAAECTASRVIAVATTGGNAPGHAEVVWVILKSCREGLRLCHAERIVRSR